MIFEIIPKELSTLSADVILLFAFEGEDTYVPTESFISLNGFVQNGLDQVAQSEKFTGKKGSSCVATFIGKIPATKVVVVGLGKRSTFTGHDFRRVLRIVAKQYMNRIDSLALSLMSKKESSLSTELQAEIVTTSFELGTYVFAQYKQKQETDRKFDLVMIVESDKKLHKSMQKGIKKGELFAQANRLARDLVNEQSSVATPTFMAQVAQDIAKKNKQITCKVFDKDELEKMGMNAFLGIARGSDTPPKFVYLEYKPTAPSKKKRKLAIVGKGITFDTGGINVKPEGYMTAMKQDMAGAAAMLGVFSVIDAIKPDFPVIGCAALTPNMISGNSIVPGDVVKAYNGKTIEVNHTDAEGRVTLADGLSYAVEKGATEIIDLATLTGACMVALGTDIAGLMSNNRDLTERIRTASFDACEEVWELPLFEDYKDQNKSDVADVSNLPTSRYGGAITAGLFLQEFVDDIPWAHIDIAGPAFSDRETPHGAKGGTGFGVGLLLEYLQQK